MDRANREDVESGVWAKTLEALGAVPINQCRVSVGDRGSDFYEYWLEARALQWHCLSRLKADRAMPADEAKLFEQVRALPPQDSRTMEDRAREAHEARTLNTSLSWFTTELAPPAGRTDLDPSIRLPVSIVRCWDDEHDVEWILLATWPVLTVADAWQCVEFYRLRWLVEEYHKQLKSGLGVEKAQLKTADRLERFVGMCSVIAVRLLQLSKAIRTAPDEPAFDHVNEDFVTVLCHRFKLDAPTLTVMEFSKNMARLGGFIKRKQNKYPGCQTLWRGYMRLADLVEGYRLGRGQTCG
jgi:hypothetical protein